MWWSDKRREPVDKRRESEVCESVRELDEFDEGKAGSACRSWVGGVWGGRGCSAPEKMSVREDLSEPTELRCQGGWHAVDELFWVCFLLAIERTRPTGANKEEWHAANDLFFFVFPSEPDAAVSCEGRLR